MRNGNYFYDLDEKEIKIISSYPTYEEWKHYVDALVILFFYRGSYPTYEEWKPIYKEVEDISYQGSYPTYEEWKQRYKRYSWI